MTPEEHSWEQEKAWLTARFYRGYCRTRRQLAARIIMDFVWLAWLAYIIFTLASL